MRQARLHIISAETGGNGCQGNVSESYVRNNEEKIYDPLPVMKCDCVENGGACESSSNEVKNKQVAGDRAYVCVFCGAK
jgi:hypothetical protein